MLRFVVSRFASTSNVHSQVGNISTFMCVYVFVYAYIYVRSNGGARLRSGYKALRYKPAGRGFDSR